MIAPDASGGKGAPGTAGEHRLLRHFANGGTIMSAPFLTVSLVKS